MKKQTLLLIATVLISAGISAKNNPIGTWLLTKVEMGDKTEEVYSEVEFKEDGYASMDGMVFGNWEYNKKGKTFTITSKMIKEFAGERTVKFSKNSMVLSGANDKLYFKKLDYEKIGKNNKDSGLEGSWVIDNTEGVTRTIIFELPDVLKVTEKSPGMNSSSGGVWIFDKKENSLILMVRERSLSGSSKVNSIDDKTLSINHKGETITASKLVAKTKVEGGVTLERLTFTEDTISPESGEITYETEVVKLPWKDYYETINYNQENVSELVYNYNVYDKNTKMFETKELLAKVDADISSEELIMDKVWVGFDRNSVPEDYELPRVKLESDNDIYPFEGYSFKVTPNQEITVPAGIFMCTAVELIGDFDEKIKFWMINNKPGVVAKIILDKEDDFMDRLEYKVLELKEIKGR